MLTLSAPAFRFVNVPSRALATLLLASVLCKNSPGAPYPEGGAITSFVQPGGKKIELRVFGDEFYARTTRDGFRVIYVKEKKAYYYAKPAPDGDMLVSSDVPADQPPPPAVPINLPDSPDTAAAVRAAKISTLAPDRTMNWVARVKAVQVSRKAQKGGFAPPNPEIVAAAAPIIGSKVGLMILVQFPDDPATPSNDPVSFPVPQTKIQRLANEPGYSDNGNSGSIRDYFFDQSGGRMTHTQLVSSVITLDHPRNYYNFEDYPQNDFLREGGATGQMLVSEAVGKMKTAGFDFSSLSVDHSGNVLATSLLFAGPDSGVWPDGLWPHASAVAPINVGTGSNPRKIKRYQCTNIETEAPVIGTITHELGHLLLGYPDLYDYQQDSHGVGKHCLMGSGNHCNDGKTPSPIDLYLKDVSGWADITDLAPNQALDATLPTTGNRGYRIRKPGSSSSEYFLIENRGAGDKWAASAPDRGIIIWHIDESVSGNNNQQMTATQHYEVSVEQADGRFDLEFANNPGDAGDLFTLSRPSFNNTTLPNADWWNGTPSGISITVKSAPAASMNLHFGP